MSNKLTGEPAAWPSDLILPLGYANVEVKILCIQYARMKEVLISKDGFESEAFWIPLSKIAILKDGEKVTATVPLEISARLSRDSRRVRSNTS
jgi:hypothetical protein